MLDALRRMLRPMRQIWEMSFAPGGEEALGILSGAPYDVIVTDMRMPGMDGATLLAEVMSCHPEVVRIVLSGQADRDVVLGAVGLIHQYLSKPCDAETLMTTVDRACTVSALLADGELKRRAARLESLPSLPSLHRAFVREIESPQASAKAVAQIVSRDLGMSAKVLQLVNSAFFGLMRHVAHPEQAAIYLGLDTLKVLSLSAHAFSQVEQVHLDALLLTALWEHSITVATFARELARAESAEQKLADQAFSAGLLHDVGRLVFAACMPEQFSSALGLATPAGTALLEAERQTLGATHADVGAYLLALWGLPEPLVMAAAFHHSPAQAVQTGFGPLVAVHIADALAYELRGAAYAPAAPQINLPWLESQGLSTRLDRWRACCQRAILEGT